MIWTVKHLWKCRSIYHPNTRGNRHGSAFTARKLLRRNQISENIWWNSTHFSCVIRRIKKDNRAFSLAFKNTYKLFKVEAEDNDDLLEVLLLEKDTQIRETLIENSQQKPVKVQLSVKLLLQKSIEEDTEKIKAHLNTDMIPVFAQGLAEKKHFSRWETNCFRRYSNSQRMVEGG